MRNNLINLVANTLKNKKNSYFLTADLGYSVLENIQKVLKKRFINVGISENNMLLLAVGLTEVSKNLVYVYSISPFLILRPAEIIRNYISNEKIIIFIKINIILAHQLLTILKFYIDGKKIF